MLFFKGGKQSSHQFVDMKLISSERREEKGQNTWKYQPLSMQMSDNNNEKKNHRDMQRPLDENGGEDGGTCSNAPIIPCIHRHFH
jgi:hypothetical protein